MKKILILILIINSLALYSDDSILFNNDLNYSQVEFVKLTESKNGSWRFDVTLRHKDTGWEHYADLWVVVDTQTDKIIGSRTLTHPHVNEQPFTRSLSGVIINENSRYIEVKSKCTLHGYEGKKVIIDLELDEGQDYKIVRSK